MFHVSKAIGVLLSLFVQASSLKVKDSQPYAFDGEGSKLFDDDSKDVLIKLRHADTKDVVVFVTAQFTEANIQRLWEIVHSVDARYIDVHVLHTGPRNKSFDMQKHPKLMEHERKGYLQIEYDLPVPKTDVWQTYGSKKSGFAKAMFMQHVLANPNYRFYWHIEDDVLLAGGDWNALFTDMATEYPDENLLSAFVDDCDDGKDDFVWGNCSMPGGMSCALASECHYKLTWMVARVDLKFASKLSEAFDEGLYGHHEAISGTFCFANPHWCKVARMPESWLAIEGGMSKANPEAHCTQRYFYPSACGRQKECDRDRVATKKVVCDNAIEGKLYHPYKDKYIGEVQAKCGTPEEDEFCLEEKQTWAKARDGWFLGALGGSCTDTCEGSNLTCSDQSLINHNDDVASESKIKELLSQFGSQCQSFLDDFTEKEDAPFWASDSRCASSSPTRGIHTIRCDVTPWETARRLCYCEEVEE